MNLRTYGTTEVVPFPIVPSPRPRLAAALETGHWTLITSYCLSVLWHLRIHAVGPGCDPAGQVVYFGEPRLLQERDCLGAAAAHLAVDHNFAAGIQFVHALGQIIQRNEMSAKIADLVLVGLAHVEDENVFLRVQTALQFFDLNFRNSISHR